MRTQVYAEESSWGHDKWYTCNLIFVQNDSVYNDIRAWWSITDCSWWYTNRQNWYTVVCILIVYIILYGIIFHEFHYIRISVLTDPFWGFRLEILYKRWMVVVDITGKYIHHPNYCEIIDTIIIEGFDDRQVFDRCTEDRSRRSRVQ